MALFSAKERKYGLQAEIPFSFMALKSVYIKTLCAQTLLHISLLHIRLRYIKTLTSHKHPCSKKPKRRTHRKKNITLWLSENEMIEFKLQTETCEDSEKRLPPPRSWQNFAAGKISFSGFSNVDHSGCKLFQVCIPAGPGFTPCSVVVLKEGEERNKGGNLGG